MKRVYIVDGIVIDKKKKTSTSNFVRKPYRYFLFIIEQNNVIDDKYYMLGFGIGTNANRKYITKKSIITLIYFLTKFLIMKEKVFYNINYTVNIGNLDNKDIIEKIKTKHGLRYINKECIFEFEDELINDFLYYYFNYGKKK